MNKYELRSFNLNLLIETIMIRNMTTQIFKKPEDKVDYRIIELSNASPTTNIRAFVVVSTKITKELLDKVYSYNIKVLKVYDFLFTIRIEGTAKTVVKLSELPEVKNILLDEILTPSESA